MSNFWKALIVILILLGILAYYFSQKEETETEVEQPVDEEQSVIEEETESEAEEEASDEESPEEISEEEVVEEPVEEPIDEIADWNTYTNEKHQYSFKYPPEYNFGPCVSKPCGSFVNEEKEGDYVILSGDISVKGWPHIGISHYDTDFYNPPAGTDLVTWLQDNSPVSEYVPDAANFEIYGMPAVKVYIPGSPQAYSSNEIYFIKNEKLFAVSMNDVDSPEAQDFYNLFLSTFEL